MLDFLLQKCSIVAVNYFAHTFSVKIGNENLPNPSAWDSVSRNSTQMATLVSSSWGKKLIWGPQILTGKIIIFK